MDCSFYLTPRRILAEMLDPGYLQLVYSVPVYIVVCFLRDVLAVSFGRQSNRRYFNKKTLQNNGYTMTIYDDG